MTIEVSRLTKLGDACGRAVTAARSNNHSRESMAREIERLAEQAGYVLSRSSWSLIYNTFDRPLK